MISLNNSNEHLCKLRSVAEECLKKKKIKPIIPKSNEEVLSLAHEMEVYQVEVEIQQQELKLAWQETEILLKKYADLFNFAPVAYFILDRESRILELNNTGITLLNTARHFILNRSFGEFVSVESVPAFKAFCSELFNKDNSCCEIVLNIPTKDPIYINLKGKLVSDDYFLVVATDTTELQHAIREKEKAQLMFMHAKKLASIGSLASGVAHEINNPLQIIMGFSSLISELFERFSPSKNLEKVKYYLKKQNVACERIASIVNALNSYSRIDTQISEVVDIDYIIQNVLVICEPIYNKTGIIIKRKFNSPDVRVKANSGKIQQVILNLLSNAKNAIEQKNISHGEIIIETCSTINEAIITITDNGIGIDNECICKIYEPFYTTKPAGKGTGLGLSVSQSIILSYGGKISVSSIKNEGSSFTVVFPLHITEMSLPEEYI